MTRLVDINHEKFKQDNINVRVDAKNTNNILSEERRQDEKDKRDAELKRDRDELKWTNDTQLRYSENKSYSDKYLK